MDKVSETAVEYSHKIFESLVPPDQKTVAIEVVSVLESLTVVASYFISRSDPDKQAALLAIWHADVLAMTAKILGDADPDLH